MEKQSSSSLKVGLALGSGASRALAHIGVIDAIKKAGIKVDYIAGSSMGALIGASYASGELNKLQRHALSMDWRQFTSYLDFNFPQQGLLEGEKLVQLIEFLVPSRTFEELQIPLGVTATDLTTGKEIDLEKGDLIHAIRASISLPGIFNPFEIDGNYLVDGGLVNPVPVDLVRSMGADFIIAVDLNDDIITRNGREKRFQVLRNSSKSQTNPDQSITDSSLLELASESPWFPPKLEQTYRSFEYSLKQSVNNLFESKDKSQQEWEPNIFDVIANSINIMEYQITRSKLMEDQPDILIQPQLGHLNLFDFDEAERTIKEGYKVTNEQLKKLNRLTTSISDD